jgi:deoxyribonuclease V
VKICKIHNTKYDYVCPECIKPFLKNTPFSTLKEIRNYQKKKAKDVHEIDVYKDIELVGIMKVKILDDFSYSGILVYNIKKKEIILNIFRIFKPIFTNYFPSILFLNQTEIYLDLLSDLDLNPDCYVVNSSGKIHPYLYGCACDFGLKIETPVIGYTKTLLFGVLHDLKESPHSEIKGVFTNNTLIGYAVPKPNSKKYFYISVGNNISLQTAVRLFLQLDFQMFSHLSIKLNNYIQKKAQLNYR